MNDKLVYLFISFAAFLNLLILIHGKEYTKCYCNQKKTPIILITTLFLFYLHYFIHCFGLYGFLFSNKWILSVYLIIPPIIVLGWTYNKSEHFKSACVLTNVTDSLCQLPKEETIHFDEIYRTLCVPDITIKGYTSNSAYFVLTIIGYIIAIYKLFKH
jgi:hypothetical protein